MDNQNVTGKSEASLWTTLLKLVFILFSIVIILVGWGMAVCGGFVLSADPKFWLIEMLPILLIWITLFIVGVFFIVKVNKFSTKTKLLILGFIFILYILYMIAIAFEMYLIFNF